MKKDEIEPSIFRANRPGVQSVLGDLEAETMNVIWQRPMDLGMSVREVHEVLQSRRTIAYTTVMTTLARLARKRLLKARKENLAYIYYPTMSQTEFTSRFVSRILDQLLDNYSVPAIAHFAELAEPESRDTVQKLLFEIVQRRKAREEKTTY